MINISMELAGKLAGQSPEQLQAALFEGEGEEQKLKDNAEETFHNLILDKFKGAERDKLKGEVGRAIRERMESLEQAAKPLFERFEINADRIEDGLQTLSEKIPGKPSKDGKPQELTTDQIKKLPAYQQLLDEEIAAQKAKTEEWERKYSDYVTETQRSQVVTAAREKALSVLDGKNAVWGQDKAQQLNYFFKAIGTDHLSVDDEGNLVLTDSDGNPLRDDARNRVSFQDYILNEWKNAGYTFHEAPPGSGSAGASRSGGEGGGSSKITITSKQHYEDLLNSAGRDFGKRAEITEAYAEFMSKGD